MRDLIKILELLNLPSNFTLIEFDEFVFNHLSRSKDKLLAMTELDNLLGGLNNFALLLSLHFKQRYIIGMGESPVVSTEPINYTKKEVAKIYRVKPRTIYNWIKDGLQTIEIGGIERISKVAIEDFIKEKKTKKFNWKSIARPKEESIRDKNKKSPGSSGLFLFHSGNSK